MSTEGYLTMDAETAEIFSLPKYGQLLDDEHSQQQG